MADIPNCPRGREEEYLSDIAGLTDNAPSTPWSRKEAYLAAIDGKMDNMEAQIAALATDISFKGSVATESSLPATAAIGDAYITEDTGIIYVYVGDTGSEPWVALGGSDGGGGGIFYFDAEQSGSIFSLENPFSIYKDSQLTQVATSKDIYDAVNDKGGVILIGMFDPGAGDYAPWISHLICYTNDDSMGAGTQEAICVIDNDKVGLLTYTSNTQKWSFLSVKDIGAPTVVQAPGTSTTNVMSQDAATKMIFRTRGGNYQWDPTYYKNYINIGGADTQTTLLGNGWGISIGGTTRQITDTSVIISANSSGPKGPDDIYIGAVDAYSGTKSVIIGNNTGFNRGGASISYPCNVLIGDNAKGQIASGYTLKGAIALGAYSQVTTSGEVNIGSTNTSYGYNSSNYRLLSGLYDPQTAHDAATKGYVDTLVGNIETALNAINNGGNA